MYVTKATNSQLKFGMAFCLIGLLLLISACGDVKVGEIDVKPAKDVEAGKTAAVGANIENPKGKPLNITWNAKRGKVESASDTSAAGIYTAPLEPGPDSITLEVRSGGKLIASKVTAIDVTGAAVVMVPPTTTRSTETPSPPQPIVFKKPLDVTAYFVPSGWMGDGKEVDEQGEPKYVTINIASRESPHSPLTCVKFTYKIDPNAPFGWAAVAYQNRDKNWGQYPGRNLQGAKKITFWARGLTGKEVVEFKAGGMMDTTPYKDSFEVLTGHVTLERTWKQYELDLTGEDLSSVISGFVWAAARAGNIDLNEITFFLDDIKYE